MQHNNKEPGDVPSAELPANYTAHLPPQLRFDHEAERQQARPLAISGQRHTAVRPPERYTLGTEARGRPSHLGSDMPLSFYPETSMDLFDRRYQQTWPGNDLSSLGSQSGQLSLELGEHRLRSPRDPRDTFDSISVPDTLVKHSNVPPLGLLDAYNSRAKRSTDPPSSVQLQSKFAQEVESQKEASADRVLPFRTLQRVSDLATTPSENTAGEDSSKAAGDPGSYVLNRYAAVQDDSPGRSDSRDGLQSEDQPASPRRPPSTPPQSLMPSQQTYATVAKSTAPSASPGSGSGKSVFPDRRQERSTKGRFGIEANKGRARTNTPRHSRGRGRKLPSAEVLSQSISSGHDIGPSSVQVPKRTTQPATEVNPNKNTFEMLADDDPSGDDSEAEDASAKASISSIASEKATISGSPLIQDSESQRTLHSGQGSGSQLPIRGKKTKYQDKLTKGPSDKTVLGSASNRHTVASTDFQERKSGLIHSFTPDGPKNEQGDAPDNTNQHEIPSAATRTQRRRKTSKRKANPPTTGETVLERNEEVSKRVESLRQAMMIVEIQPRPRSSLWALLSQAWTSNDSKAPLGFTEPMMENLLLEDVSRVKKVARLWRSDKVSSDDWARKSLSAFDDYSEDTQSLMYIWHGEGHDMWHKKGCTRSATQDTNPFKGGESRCCAHPEGPIALARGEPAPASSSLLERLRRSVLPSVQSTAPQCTHHHHHVIVRPFKKNNEKLSVDHDKQEQFRESSLFADLADFSKDGMGVSSLGDTSRIHALSELVTQSLYGMCGVTEADDTILRKLANVWLKPTITEDIWTMSRERSYNQLSPGGKTFVDASYRDTYHNRDCEGFAKDGKDSICCAHPDAALAKSSVQISKKSSAEE